MRLWIDDNKGPYGVWWSDFDDQGSYGAWWCKTASEAIKMLRDGVDNGDTVEYVNFVSFEGNSDSSFEVALEIEKRAEGGVLGPVDFEIHKGAQLAGDKPRNIAKAMRGARKHWDSQSVDSHASETMFLCWHEDEDEPEFNIRVWERYMDPENECADDGESAVYFYADKFWEQQCPGTWPKEITVHVRYPVRLGGKTESYRVVPEVHVAFETTLVEEGK